MQQYFINQKIKENDIINLEDNVIYHLKKVLRKDSSYTFRVCENQENIYLCHLLDDNSVSVDKYIDENNELDVRITAVISLIKFDKLELILQKLVELGIYKIVLYQARRSVVKLENDKKFIRLNRIILEACEQSHRNIIPELVYVNNISDLKPYLSKDNYICYENENNIVDININDDITYIIGPEGGFEDNEYQDLLSLGFNPISLGKRILRAETAAIYMSSIIVSKCQ